MFGDKWWKQLWNRIKLQWIGEVEMSGGDISEIEPVMEKKSGSNIEASFTRVDFMDMDITTRVDDRRRFNLHT